jgi:hypothetical protein
MLPKINENEIGVVGPMWALTNARIHTYVHTHKWMTQPEKQHMSSSYCFLELKIEAYEGV